MVNANYLISAAITLYLKGFKVIRIMEGIGMKSYKAERKVKEIIVNLELRNSLCQSGRLTKPES